MHHLIYVIAFTGRFDEMRRFYERGLDLPVRRAEPDWVEFDTAGASIALHRMADPSRQGTMLRFATVDFDASLDELRQRGLEPDGEILDFRGARYAHFWDADGNPLTLVGPVTPPAAAVGPALETLIVNVADMVAATAFYRDRFGIPVLLQSPWWTELDTGATKLSLHPRVAPTSELRHNAQPVVVGFEVPSLEELGRELAGRGLVFSGGPVDQRYGRFAEVTDPDGNVVLFRRSEPRTPLEPEGGDDESPAAAWEDDAPRRAAMRKPAKKPAQGLSRLAVKPAYKRKRKPKQKAGRRGPAKVTPLPNAKRAKSRPATGRLKKAERRGASRKKAASARAGRTKPVKRAAARRSARSRGR